jgi:tartrate dehydratase beta subunit/fumarate hydratase class I family protein
MMPINFNESNIVYNKPENMTDEDCSTLHAFRGHDQSELPVIITKWQLSKEDLEEIQKTGCVYLTVVGQVLPPVSVYTENPFE